MATGRLTWKWTILNLTPAQLGWRALYAGEDWTWTESVAFWGLLEAPADGHRWVEGFVSGSLGMEEAEQAKPQFVGYLEPGAGEEVFAEAIEHSQAEQRRERAERERRAAAPRPTTAPAPRLPLTRALGLETGAP
jgi:hypothetical protein